MQTRDLSVQLRSLQDHASICGELRQVAHCTAVKCAISICAIENLHHADNTSLRTETAKSALLLSEVTHQRADSFHKVWKHSHHDLQCA